MSDAPVRPSAKRLAHRSTGRRNGRSAHLPQQQLADIGALLASLDFNYGVDVGYELGALAAHQRRLTRALHEQSQDETSRQNVAEDARYLITHKHPLLWPLPATQVPAPNFLLADEVAAIAERYGNVSRATAGTHWMACHHALCQVLAHLALFPSSTCTPEMVEKEAAKHRQSTSALPSEQLERTLQGCPDLAQRRLAACTLDWRDVLAAVYASRRPRAAAAANAVHARMRALFDAHPVEPCLERRTWSMKRMPDPGDRAARVRQAMQRAQDAAPMTQPRDLWQAACMAHDPRPEVWDGWGWTDADLPTVPDNWEREVADVFQWESEYESEDVASDAEADDIASSDPASSDRSPVSSSTELRTPYVSDAPDFLDRATPTLSVDLPQSGTEHASDPAQTSIPSPGHGPTDVPADAPADAPTPRKRRRMATTAVPSRRSLRRRSPRQRGF